MIDCNEVRELLALEPASENEGLQTHLVRCARCARYRRQYQALDVVLPDELRWRAPAALTAQLLALAAAGPAALTAPVVAWRGPKRWYVAIVYLLTTVAIGLSLVIVWQFLALLAAQFGLGDALAQMLAAPSQGFDQLMRALPVSHVVIDFFLKLREQLMWLLLAAVLWAILDKWNPQLSLRRRPVSS